MRRKKKTTRTKSPKISMIITIRGHEPLAQSTCECARDTAGRDIELIVVCDGQRAEPWMSGVADQVIELDRPTCPQRARHEGIIRSSGDLVVLTDAHMRFSDRWAPELAAYYRDEAGDSALGCCMIGTLSESGSPSDDTPYRGAALYERMIARTGEQLAMVARWCPDNQPGHEIGAIMGAFYVLRRAWYDAMGQPLATGMGWGCDEERLSLTAHLTGGRVLLLPDTIRAWHEFRGAPRYALDGDHIARLWIERLKLILALPAPQDYVQTLATHMAGSRYLADVPGVIERARAEAARPAERAWSSKLRADLWPVVSERWLRHGVYDERPGPGGPVEHTTTTTAPAMEQPSHAAWPLVRIRDVCPRCDAIDSFRVYGSRRDVQYVRCAHCGFRGRRKVVTPRGVQILDNLTVQIST